MTTYPFSALLDKLGNPTVGPGSRTLGISGAAFNRYRERGLDADQADRLANRVGFHPLEVWPEWGTLECPHCGDRFHPYRSTQRYCSPECSDRAVQARSKRRRYYTDPEHRAAKLAANREYKRYMRAKKAARMNADRVFSRETVGDNRNAPALRQQPGARPTPSKEASTC